jgi:phosphonatase-like hydrolase
MIAELVVFDIAGTTVFDNGNVNAAFRSAFGKAGVAVEPADVDKVMGYRKIEAIKIIMEQYAPGAITDNPELLDRIHDVFVKDMVQFYKNDKALQPLPHVIEVFEWLQQQQIKVALDTGFTREITTPILHRLGWNNTNLIQAVSCSDEVPEGRPYPYMIRSLMTQTGVADVKKVIKVGDTEVDIQEGRNAGCGLVVAVTTGAYTREQLEPYQPDYIIDSLRELPAKIQLL